MLEKSSHIRSYGGQTPLGSASGECLLESSFLSGTRLLLKTVVTGWNDAAGQDFAAGRSPVESHRPWSVASPNGPRVELDPREEWLQGSHRPSSLGTAGGALVRAAAVRWHRRQLGGTVGGLQRRMAADSNSRRSVFSRCHGCVAQTATEQLTREVEIIRLYAERELLPGSCWPAADTCEHPTAVEDAASRPENLSSILRES